MVVTDEYGHFTRSIKVAHFPPDVRVWIVTRWQKDYEDSRCWDASIEINFSTMPLNPLIETLGSIGDCRVFCHAVSGKQFKPYAKIVINPPYSLEFKPIIERLKWVEKTTEVIIEGWVKKSGMASLFYHEYNWRPKLYRIMAKIITQGVTKW